jgi:adenine C2-methylase RlmN of 23S rRNA A2503 and tRNA A37
VPIKTDLFSNSIEKVTAWEQSTAFLCHLGVQANTLISEIFQRGQEDLLLADDSEELKAFRKIVVKRAEYWGSRKELSVRAEAWCKEIERGLKFSVAALNRLGLLRQIVWLKHSTIPLLKQATSISIIEHLEGTIANLEKQLDLASITLATIESKNFCDIYLHRHFETTLDFLARTNRRNFINIYKIDKASQQVPRFVEVVESWDFSKSERITLCVPISVGCQNSCSMCDLGSYFGGNLSASEIQQIIALNLAANIDIPISRDNFTIYYLGGGDAGLNRELPKLLEEVKLTYPNVRQVISTIGMKVEADMISLLEAIAKVPDVGFQISVCSLDDKIRMELVNNNRRALSVSECIEYLGKFSVITRRKGYLSLFLLKDIYENVDQIAKQAIKLLDPNLIHISLTYLRPNELPSSKSGAPKESYDTLKNLLVENGFEVSIITNDEDPENSVACGCMESDVISSNKAFQKTDRRALEL